MSQLLFKGFLLFDFCLALLLTLLCTVSAYAAPMPDLSLTPGDVTAVTTAEVCTPGYSKKVRNVPDSEKLLSYKLYGITSHPKGSYEVDHLISLELGGSNSLKNLWPQPYAEPMGAHEKDALENRLHWLVCHGQLKLEDAQMMIRTDWTKAYEKYGLGKQK